MSNKKTRDQLSVLASQRVKEKEYWLHKLADFPGKSQFPSDYNKKGTLEFRLESVSFDLSSQLSSALMKLSTGSDVRLHIILAAGIKALLNRYLEAYNYRNNETEGHSDIVIGCPILKPEQEADLINLLLVLRTHVQSQMSFKELLLEVQKTVAEALENCNYPVKILAEQLSLTFSPGEQFPLFDIVVLLENIHDKKVLADIQPGMIFSFNREDSSIRGSIEYNSSLYNCGTVERIATHVQGLLEHASTTPGENIAALEIMSPGEKEQLLTVFNNTKTSYPAEKAIHELFAGQAEQTPDHIAIVGNDNDKGSFLKNRPLNPQKTFHYLTYSQLNDQSDCLAGLLMEKGVLAGDIVAIRLERSVEMIITILGILKAGSAYMPIDPDYPDERINYMLKDSSAKILINKSEARISKFETNTNDQNVNVQNKNEKCHEAFVLNFENLSFEFVSNFEFRISDLISSNLAYVIYTSGSTGKPKGVMLSHRNVVRLVKNTNFVPLNRGTRILQTGAPVFDATTFEIWGSLLNGGQLVLTDKETILDAHRLAGALSKNRINTLWLSAPLFNQLSEENLGLFSPLRYLLVGGDVLSPTHINRIKQRFPGLSIINGYGPTENTTFSTTYLIEKEFEHNIPIGRPIANSTAYIYDKNNRLTPIGVVGELYVGGDGVALGYLNNPELTAERFIFFPHFLTSSLPGFHLYRTGDLARWLPNANIEFLGRVDYQVKIRGFRVELDEIENFLSSYDGIKETVVVAAMNETGDKYLCAYICAESRIEVSQLQNDLSKKLPDYMIPSCFVFLEKLPLNPNGKVDRKALPEPDRSSIINYAPPQNETENLLVDIWSDILGINRRQIGVHDNFFQLGGHSLKAVSLTGRIYKAFFVEVSIAELFKTPTIKGISDYIQKSDKKIYFPIQPVEEKDYYPLSSAQKRLYLLYQADKSSTAYNMPAMFKLKGQLNEERLTDIFKKLIKRHESLRTSFEQLEGEPVQRIHREVDFEIEFCSPEASESTMKFFVHPFDLSKAPLLRVGLLKMGEEDYILAFDMHHIISDGTSMGILIREFTTLYSGSRALSSLPLTQYKDYACWQNSEEWRQSLNEAEAFWMNLFSPGEQIGKIPKLKLPADYVHTGERSFEGAVVTSELSYEETNALKNLANEEEVTLYMLLFALFNVLLARLSGQEDIIVGTPLIGRQREELQHTIGMFINTLALRNFPKAELTFREFLKDVKKNTLNAFKYQDFPFEKLVEKVVLDWDKSRNPLFDVIFGLQNIDIPELQMPGISLKPYPYANTTAKFAVDFLATEKNEILLFSVNYSTKLFKAETMEQFIIYFKDIITVVLDNKDIRLENIKLFIELSESKSALSLEAEGNFEL